MDGQVIGQVIDSHHHFWWTARHTYTWPAPAGDRLARDFTPDDLRPELARCGIDGTVLIQVLHQVGGETEESLDISRDVDFVRGVVGWLPLIDPDATAQALERLRGRGKLVGVRHLISNEPDPRWLLQETVIESLGLLAAAGMVFDAIPITPAQAHLWFVGWAKSYAPSLPQPKSDISDFGRPNLKCRTRVNPSSVGTARARFCPRGKIDATRAFAHPTH